jgi:hypothetical protein
MTTRRLCWLAACAAAVAVAAGCDSVNPTDALPPTVNIKADRMMCQVGQDVTVTVRLTAPGDRKLDVYLPIRGRLHVQEKGAILEMSPAGPDARQLWVDVVPDDRYKAERAFAVQVGRMFPLTKEPGWYEIWWTGNCDYCSMRSERILLRVFTQIPAGLPGSVR